jgi:hypothetical protein
VILKEHERFEEFASLAPLGELSQGEYEEFLTHLNGCNQCRKTYGDGRAVAEAAFVVGSSIEEDKVVEDQRFRRSRQAIARRLGPAPSLLASFRISLAMSTAAVAVIIAFVAGMYVRAAMVRPHSQDARLQAPEANGFIAPASGVEPKLAPPTESPANWNEVEHQLEVARSEKQLLQEKVQRSGHSLSALTDEVRILTEGNERQMRDQQQTSAQLEEAKSTLAKAQVRIQSDQALINNLQLESSNREARLSDLENSLAREREMLSAGREVRDIMGARDLHIVDVVDRDGKGRVRNAFGRAFYTQGKSLIFYAFDLPVKNPTDGKFVYAAWGNNSNNLNNKAAHSLGIFYSDDQTQHRWAMKFDDPKTLEEIDTVFVTLEPANHPLTAPTGKSVLEAYFGTPPNHP